ncbi:MAG: bifunctional precorrin-2 dehydrogenase/sirohydrochlorin ferrochelatase [Desulfotomaculaceae bacterium]|nr:bifunctional precorrin-2 dehydrogenase/sirohydrochlorin ferrochelatase [Desulfotomaculaceae bacterium]
MFGRYFISLDLTDKKCLVVGGGQVAERKVRSLLECNARIYVVSPELSSGLKSLVEKGEIAYRCGCYQSSDLGGVFLVIGSTGNEDANQKIADDCADRNIIVNIVDDPTKGNFFVPATVRRGPFTIAISTGGRSPLFARKIREELEKKYGPHYGEFLDMLGSLREDVISRVYDPEKKKVILESFVGDEILDLLRKGQMDLVKERLLSAYRGSWS